MKLIKLTLLVLFLLPSIAHAQVPSTQTNGTVTATASLVLPFDWGRWGWCIHVDAGTNNVRCKTGNLATPPTLGGPPNPEPTTSVGYEILVGSTVCASLVSGTTDPRTEVDCAAESGSANWSAWIDYKPY